MKRRRRFAILAVMAVVALVSTMLVFGGQADAATPATVSAGVGGCGSMYPHKQVTKKSVKRKGIRIYSKMTTQYGFCYPKKGGSYLQFTKYSVAEIWTSPKRKCRKVRIKGATVTMTVKTDYGYRTRAIYVPCNKYVKAIVGSGPALKRLKIKGERMTWKGSLNLKPW